MVLPAIHLTRADVAALLRRETGQPLEAEIPRLVRVARQQLREKFLRADIGITGANIAVAETGSLVLCTNEGNARLVATLPPVHIAIVGLEKLVERFEDIEPILAALPRSATAQPITSYVSILTGPAEAADGGPKEMHTILYGHRRAAMAEDPVFRRALQCIRCASLPERLSGLPAGGRACVRQGLHGGHRHGAYGVDRGLGGVAGPRAALHPVRRLPRGLPSADRSAGADSGGAPPRRRAAAYTGLAERTPLTLLEQHRRLSRRAARGGAGPQRPLAERPYLRHLPLFFTDAGKNRRLPVLAAEPLRDRFPRLSQPRSGRRVALFAGCLIDFVYPEIGEAIVRVLNRAGIEVVFPEGQTCCGAPARFSGLPEAALANIRDNTDALLGAGVEAVVSACPTCTAALRLDSAKPARAEGRADLAERAGRLAAVTEDFPRSPAGWRPRAL